MLFRTLAVCFVFLTLAGCAELPPSDYDYLRAADIGDDAAHLNYMRMQGERISGVPFVGGNQVVLLQDGKATYPAMLAAIRKARRRIDMESFIFDSKEGSQFADALLKRRARGVQVNLIYDSFGSQDAPQALFDRLRAGGVKVVEYNPIDALSVVDTTADHRDHRKLLLIDGQTAFVGGINISVLYRLKLKLKETFRVHSDDLDPDHTPWRDTHIRIDGPVVGEFERLYMRTWHEQHGPAIADPPAPPRTPRGTLFVEAIDGTPDRDRYNIYQSLLLTLTLARHSVHLTTGFFVPPPELVSALENAAQRGVDVTLILPGQSDSDFALHAGHAYYDELLRAGIHIYERQGVILHAKTAVIDGLWSTVGSSNLDWRSAVINNECNAVVLGSAFGHQMEAMFQ